MPSINLTICWKLLKTFGTNLVIIQKIGQSAGNQIYYIKNGILRDYMLNIGRFMLFTSKMYLSNTIMSNYKFYNYKEMSFYLTGL